MKRVRIAAVTALGLALVGCGKYGPPIPPEALSPAAVSELKASAAADSITLVWEAPERDRRKKELRSIEGYRVVRTVVSADGTGKPPVEVAFVEDTHIRVRDDLRARAEAEGRSARRVKADSTLSNFSVVDSAVESGTAYIYRVVPVNQGGVEGDVRHQIRVAFNGVDSRISKSALADLDATLFAESLAGGAGEDRNP